MPGAIYLKTCQRGSDRQMNADIGGEVLPLESENKHGHDHRPAADPQEAGQNAGKSAKNTVENERCQHAGAFLFCSIQSVLRLKVSAGQSCFRPAGFTPPPELYAAGELRATPEQGGVAAESRPARLKWSISCAKCSRLTSHSGGTRSAQTERPPKGSMYPRPARLRLRAAEPRGAPLRETLLPRPPDDAQSALPIRAPACVLRGKHCTRTPRLPPCRMTMRHGGRRRSKFANARASGGQG